MSEQTTKEKQPGKNRWLIDAKERVLGRLATEAAGYLMGKGIVGQRKNRLADVKVVIINADQVVLTGNKEQDKVYQHYTGYPSGVRTRNVAEQRRRDARVIVEQAVFGMLPKNKLRARMMTKLLVYRGQERPERDSQK